MADLWSFLLQTLTASLAALFLLALKGLFADKLSPRWQYGIWAILALRLLLPAGLGLRQVFPALTRGLEYVRLTAELSLHSALSGPWTPIRVTAPVPLLSLTPPASVTDWLFFLYAVGAAALGGWFLLCYWRLRRSLTLAAGAEQTAQVERVCRQYGLRPPVRVARSHRTETAFVCGPLRPVLVLPAGRDVDDKVLLHELLHLKYGDLWWNTLLCIFRCLHWCNPFLWQVFNRVGNDGEALCDQRVLERLEGEDRRDYGRLLLSMAGGRYARAPGTSSMANGSRNIAARVKAIARFRRFPGGMAPVSLCMGAAVAIFCLWGSPASASELPHGYDALNRAMASAQVNRPSTLAGALDTWAKGILYDNGIYLAMVSDGPGQEALYRRLAGNPPGNYTLARPARTAPLPTAQLPFSGLNSPYGVLSLTREGDTARGWVVFALEGDGESIPLLLCHVTAVRDSRYGWVVEQTETRQVDYNGLVRTQALPGWEYAVDTPEWHFSCRWTVVHAVDSRTDGGIFDRQPNLQAEFDVAQYDYTRTLTLTHPDPEGNYILASGWNLFEGPEGSLLPDTVPASPAGEPGSDFSSSDGSWSFSNFSTDGTAWSGGGGSGPPEDRLLPRAMEVSVRIDGVCYGPYTLFPEVVS